jgi:peptidoglycan/xylan/chitin deacetylase (PgdA/CDA1 family)
MLQNRFASHSVLLGLSTLVCVGVTCGGVPPDERQSQPEAQAQAVEAGMLELDFNPKPPYLDKNVIVLTFDDGPDGQYTAKVLDILKEKQVKSTFFINTINQTNVDNEAAAQNLVKRIVAEGHELASHTVHHIDLAVQTEAKIEEEIVGVENSVAKIFGAGGPKMTLLRSPFGRPYQSAAGSAAYKKVSAVVSKHAIHVGWNFDSNDWMYQGNADRVYSSVTGLIKKPGEGAYGIVLMHSINPQTVGALPRIIDYIRANGFVLKQVEDVVRARFGKSSAELFGAPSAGGASGNGAGGAGGAGPVGTLDAGADAQPGAGDASAPIALDAEPADGSNTGGTAGGGAEASGGNATAGNTGGGSAGNSGSGGSTPRGTGGTSSGSTEGAPVSTPSSGGCSYGAAESSGSSSGAALGLGLIAVTWLRRRRLR